MIERLRRLSNPKRFEKHVLHGFTCVIYILKKRMYGLKSMYCMVFLSLSLIFGFNSSYYIYIYIYIYRSYLDSVQVALSLSLSCLELVQVSLSLSLSLTYDRLKSYKFTFIS